MALDDTLLEAEEKMIKTEEVVQHEFAGVRTGKASPSLVENVLVEVYGRIFRRGLLEVHLPSVPVASGNRPLGGVHGRSSELVR